MPLLQEPVWDTAGVFLPELLLSDSSETSQVLRLHLEPASVLTPPSDPFTSSPVHAWWTAVEAERFSASVTGWRRTQTEGATFEHCRKCSVQTF